MSTHAGRNSFVRPTAIFCATRGVDAVGVDAVGVDAVGVDRICCAAYNGNGCAAGKRGAANRRGIF